MIDTVSLGMGIYKNKENNLTTSTNGKFVKKAVFRHHLHWVYSCVSFLLEKKQLTAASPGGLEPPTFRLTAECDNRLRHGDQVNIT